MRKIGLIIYFSIFTLYCVAQEIGLPLIRNYLPKEFIYSPQVYSAIQDKRGIMYFGITDYGILEYDGVSWKGIPNKLKSEVYSLTLDSNGKIYLAGTNDFGYLIPDQKGKLAYKSLKFLIEDSSAYIGNVWNVNIVKDSAYFFTERCIYVYSIKQNKISSIKPEEGFTFYVPFVFDDEYYILHSNKGILKLHGKKFLPIPQTSFFSQNIFLSVLPYDANSVLIPTRTSGLYILNLKGTKPLKKLNLIPSNEFLEDNNIYTSLNVNNYFILGSMRKGAIIIDNQGHIIQQFNESNLLQNNLVLSSATDFSNSIWLTMSNGISKTDLSQDLSYWDKNYGLKGVVNGITRYDGTIYLVTNQQVFFLNNGNHYAGDKSYVNKAIGVKGIPVGQNWCLYHFKVPQNKNSKIEKKEILLAGTQNGIFEIIGDRARLIYKGSLHSFAICQSKKNPNRIFSTDGFTDFISLTYQDGVWKSEGKWEGMNDDVRSILEDQNGELWIGTFTNGIIRVRINENSITQPQQIKYYKIKDGLPSLSGCKPFLFKGNIITGTEKGLYFYNSTNDRFEPYNEIGKRFCDGSMAIESFIDMPNGNIYLSSKNLSTGHIGYLIPNKKGDYTWIYKPFCRLPESIATITAMHVDEDGVIWIGGNEGLYRYDPSKDLKKYDLDFSCLIRKVGIGKDSVIYWGNQDDSRKKDIPKINYRYNSIRFNYAAPFYDKEDQTKYSYILDEFDDTWSPWTSATFKEYTNVKEGKYVFKVKALNIYGKESTIAEYNITILSPWYRTIWAYIVYGILLLCLYVFTTRSYSRVLIFQKQKLEKAVQKRTREIRKQKEEIQSQAEEMATQSEELQEQAEILKRINEELEKLSIVARETDNAIIIMNEKGQFLWVNDGFTRLYGYTMEEFFTSHTDIIEASTSINIKDTIQKCINRKITVVYESTHKTKDGKTLHVQTTITPVIDIYGKIQKLVAIESDISKLKEAEIEIIHKNEEITDQKEELLKHRYHLEQIVKERTAELEIAKNKAEESDKLKSAFLANMSHEIRTPMNAIIGFSSMLRNSEILEEEREEFIQLIAKNGNTLLQLIDDIIDIAKIEVGQLSIDQKNFDLNELLNNTYNNFLQKKALYYHKNVDLKFLPETESQPYFIITDPLRLQQVVVNLLDNAFKFTDSGLIEFGYTLQTKQSKPFIKFFVKDSGIGLTLEEQKLIFNRFTKIENSNSKLYRGTGLGLAICKNIVNLLEGEIGVESELKRGSTFFFTIPLKNNTIQSELSNTTRMNKIEYNWNGKTLLVAEDEDSNFRFIEVLLKRTKVKILRAINGKEAIEKFTTNSIDLILMDIKMPVMDGLEATKEIKRINSHIPIIAQTAYAMQNDEKICLEAGCNEYISKPILQDKLLTMLNRYLG